MNSPIITLIEPQCKKKDRFNIYIDDEFAFGIDSFGLLEHRLILGKIMTADKVKEIKYTIEFANAKNAALAYIAKGSRSYREVHKKLKEKKYSDDIAIKVSSELKQMGYINDHQLALDYIQHKLEIDNWGKRRIVYSLALKGINRSDIISAFEEYTENNEGKELEAAKAALERKLRINEEWKKDPKAKMKIYSFLARRGFSPDIIKRVME